MTTGQWIAAVVMLAGVLYGLSWKKREDSVTDEWLRDQIRTRGRRQDP